MIHDIYSKKKIIESPKEKVLVDFREKNSLIPTFLINKGLRVEFKNLEVGDYFVNGVLIERKTLQDFSNSMINKRLNSQIKNLKVAENKLLIIEGNDLKSDVNRKALKGFEISIMINHKIPILRTNSGEETAKIILMLANQKKNNSSLVENKKELTKEERQKFVLESFQGIGPSKSKQLLEKFGSIKNILNSSEKELEEVLGKRTSSFLRIIN